jgi:hypothetical protein
MNRVAAVGVALMLVLGCSVCGAQVEEAIGGAVPEQELPAFAARTVSGEAVVDLADFVCAHVESVGAVPDLAQVTTADGNLRQVSAAEAFVLLGRTTYLWQLSGQLPATVPIAPDWVSAPVLDYEDVVAAGDPSEGREVATEAFLAQCGAVVRWIDRLQTLPTAVWVEGERLSAAEYMAGLAICVSYAYWEGNLLGTVFVPNYGPPQSWLEAAPYEAAEYGPEEAWEEVAVGEAAEETAWEEVGEEGTITGLPLAVAPAFGPTFSSRPELVVLPQPGSRVGGVVDLVASYTGPPAAVVVFDLGPRSRVAMNFPPYSVRWDTTELEAGWYRVRVQVLGEGDEVLADQTAAYEVVPPEAMEPPGEAASDL